MAALEARAHANLCDFTRWNGRLDPATVTLDEDGVVATANPDGFLTVRTAIRSSGVLPAARWAAVVDEFFAAHGRTSCIHARVGLDDDLTGELLARGYREWSTSPEMVCDHALEPRDPPAGVTLRFARTPADIAAYAQIAAEAFAHLHLPHEATIAAVDCPEQFLSDDCVVSLAELGGVPVAGAQVLLFDGGRIGYVGWVSCRDDARGRGLGDTVTRAVTNEAFRRGADLVTLEASSFGEHTYARMGYREIYRYRMLIRL